MRIEARQALAVVLYGWALFVMTGTGVVPMAGAAEQAGAGDVATASAVPDSLLSYWGPLPAPADSVSSVYQNRSRPLWAKTLYYPYRLLSTPFYVLSLGLNGSAAALMQWKLLRGFIGGFDGPWGTSITPNITAGGLLGFGGGLNLSYPVYSTLDENRFRLVWQSTVRGSHRLTGAFMRPLGAHSEGTAGASYRLIPNARYFGIGPAALESAESFYTEELTWGGLCWDRRLGKGFALRVVGLYSTLGNRGPIEGANPPLEEEFADDLPPGWGHRSDGFSIHFGLSHDDAQGKGRPDSGGLRRLKLGHFFPTDENEASFWTYRVELQQFIPLWLTRRTLALRGFLTKIDPAGDKPVHFQRLMTNDDPDLLRGYDDFRWRDLGLVAVNLEYRWAIWSPGRPRQMGGDAYVFADYGQVFGQFDQIGWADFTQSYGFGFRIVGIGNRFSGRLEFAWSRDEQVVRLRADQIFQFSKGGIFYGRNPVPMR